MLLSTSTTVLAAEDVPVQPAYVGISSVAPLIRLKSNNTVICSGSVTCKAGYTARVIWNLQYQNNRTWVSVKSWNNSGNHVLLNQAVAVISGRTYRLQVVATVYNSAGKQVETVTASSEAIRA